MKEKVVIIENKIQKQCRSTALNEIKFLRRGEDFLIDQRNSNRYRVMVKESIGHTAYCFSTPIYNDRTRKIIGASFEKEKDIYRFTGSNASVSIYQNRCVLEKKDGKIVIYLNETPNIQGDVSDSQENVVIIPSLNGIHFMVRGNHFNFELQAQVKQHSIRFHPTCFSIMSEEFKPFLSLATLYASDGKGNYSPVEMNFLDKGNQKYDISFHHEIEKGIFHFEINLYEPKMFQDTTVESLLPEMNNAYGAVGFIGATSQFGEQWLYSRPDFSKIPDLVSEKIEQVYLHIPILNGSSENIDAYIPEKRFCSFGSTWNKKINSSSKVASSNNSGRYLTIDVTQMFTNRTDKTLVYNEGLILKKPKGKNNFIVISTGDCYSAPQILEIKLKK